MFTGAAGKTPQTQRTMPGTAWFFESGISMNAYNEMNAFFSETNGTLLEKISRRKQTPAFAPSPVFESGAIRQISIRDSVDRIRIAVAVKRAVRSVALNIDDQIFAAQGEFERQRQQCFRNMGAMAT